MQAQGVDALQLEQDATCTAESEVLSSILRDPATFPIAANILSDSDFSNSRNARVFGAMADCYAKGQPPDIVTICNADPGIERLYLAELLSTGDGSPFYVENYAQIVAEHSRKRQRADLVGRIGMANHAGDLAEVIRLGQRLNELVAIDADVEPIPVSEPRRKMEPPWPQLHEAALHGLAGVVVRTIEPTTEADRVALLATFLVYVGNMVGRSPHINIGDTRHGTNLFATLVGGTGQSRKGTSEGSIHRVFMHADSEWIQTRKKGGLSTGEGLIHQIRDARSEINKKGEEVLVDAGETDKRLMCTEEELALGLKTIARQGNTLSEIERQCWDSRSTLQTMTKLSPSKASLPHVSILAHITKEELARHVSESEMANGLLNRYLWFVVRRSKFLPEPVRLGEQTVADMGRQIAAVKQFAVRAGELRHDNEARAVWAEIYEDLATGKPGLAGAMTARAAPIVRRLSLIYALLDRSPAIRRDHLQAALAVWEFSAASVGLIFGDLTGDSVADRIISVLRQSPTPMTQSAVSEVFGRNVPATRLAQAFEVLLDSGRVVMWQASPREGRGRPRTLWKAVT